MLLISHRGNINGKSDYRENDVPFVVDALNNKGYDVEIDVWFLGGNFALGHDYPQRGVSKSFLKTKGLWLHCKNAEALSRLSTDSGCNCFFHDEDSVVLTSKLYLWTYPGVALFDNSICVLPELFPDQDMSKAAGVCSDFIERYRND
jgi:hypothetical protein